MNELDLQRQRALQRQQTAVQQQTARDVAREEELKVGEDQRYIAARNQNAAIARIVHVVDFLFGILELLLAARILLHMLAANPSNPFANFVYTLSEPFVALFANLVQNPKFTPNSVLEVTTLIAMLVYGVLAWIIGRLVWLVLSRPR